METLIPFTGFYYSPHSEMLDYELESMAEDDKDIEVDWGRAYAKYASVYAERLMSLLSDALGFPVTATFKVLSSPREYNFTTDRIFADIDDALLPALLDKADKDKLDALIADRFTSRSGFISYYRNSLEEWGPIETWDHNQVGTLIEHLLLEHCDSYDLQAYNLMEGQTYDIVCDAIINKEEPNELA